MKLILNFISASLVEERYWEEGTVSLTTSSRSWSPYRKVDLFI